MTSHTHEPQLAAQLAPAWVVDHNSHRAQAQLDAPQVPGHPIPARQHRARVRNHSDLPASTQAFILLCLLLAASVLHAQAPSDAYRIAGHVLNAATGQPVRSATVSLLNEDNTNVVAITITDPEGNFAFDRLPPGKYPLSASRRGFRTTFYNEHDEFSSAIVTGPDQDTTHLSLQLKPGAVLYGTVSGDGGDPVEGASVLLFKVPAHPGERVSQVNTSQTDDAGNYEFADLPDGSYYVAVQAQPWYAMHNLSSATAASSPLDVAFPLTFYDSVTQESGASPIELTFGARRQADITLHAVPAVHLKVDHDSAQNAVLDVHQVVFGIPVPSGDLQTVVGATPIENGGSTLTALAPGHYVITHGNPPRTVELDAGSAQEIPAEAGSPTVAISGTVRNLKGAPVEAGNVQLDPGPDARGRAAIESPLDRGRFHIDGFAPGDWNLSVSAGVNPQAEAAVVSISQAGRTSSGSQITVGDRPLNLSVTVSRFQTKVQGLAQQAGKPASGAMIVLIPRDPHAFPSLARRDQSDSDGTFSLRDVPPGRYTVIAILDGWSLDWQRFDLMRRFLPGGVSIEVPEQAGVVRLSRRVEAAKP